MTVGKSPPFFYLDFDDPTSRTIIGSDFSAAKNKTLGSPNFTQPTALDRPALDIGGINGVDSLQTDRLNASEHLESLVGTATASELVIFLFIKFGALSVIANTVMLHLGDIPGGIQEYLLQLRNSDSRILAQVFNGAIVDTVVSDNPVSAGNTYLITMRYSNVLNLHDMRVNGVTQASTSTVSQPTIGLGSAFGNIEGGGARCGTIDYGRSMGFFQLEPHQIAQIERNILNHYGL